MSAPEPAPYLDDAFVVEDDDGLIVLNKPSGIPTAGDSLEQPGSLQFDLMQRFRRMVWAVHQLDRDTSGLNVFVRRKRMVAEWSEHLRDGRKTYLVLCEGSYPGGRVDAPLGWVGQGVRGVTAEGKEAATTFRALARSASVTLLEAELHTGRSHQIRLHLAHVGHPVVGDVRYGGAPHPSGSHLLHAWRIQAAGRLLEAPPPPGFVEAVVDAFGEVPWH